MKNKPLPTGLERQTWGGGRIQGVTVTTAEAHGCCRIQSGIEKPGP